jgi:hypothetical protein
MFNCSWHSETRSHKISEEQVERDFSLEVRRPRAVIRAPSRRRCVRAGLAGAGHLIADLGE